MKNNFYSINRFFEEYAANAAKSDNKKVSFAFVRNEEQIFVYSVFIAYNLTETELFLEKLVKSLLYIVGCSRIIVDDLQCVSILSSLFSEDGKRSFDYKFFSRAFKANLQFEYAIALPDPRWSGPKAGGKEKGKRIGFDAGGSDIKVCAVVDGKSVFSEETLWLPKLNSDPDYHYEFIRNAIAKAYNILGGAESLGVSTAGVVANNEVRIASLFIKVPETIFDQKVKDIYIRIADEFNLPLIVANDGDVAAYEGALELNADRLLGIAMGTSEAGGYVDKDRNINGWLNELAFVPIDMSNEAIRDEWSGDVGCGAKYLSQDAVIRLAQEKEFNISNDLTLAEKLKIVQLAAERKELNALDVFDTVGFYLGEAICYYSRYYDIG
ncbi:MAG: ROK family protein, partial [Clostridia bacterium]|nr:ROK family protein [Clostridia bacterium]